MKQEILNLQIGEKLGRHVRTIAPASPLFVIARTKKQMEKRHISPFEKIRSKAFICQSTLPGFLKEPSRIKTFKTQLPDVELFPVRLESKKTILSDIEEFVNSGCKDDGFCLRVCGVVLGTGDLLTLGPGRELSSKVVDACLKLLQKKNERKIDLKKEPLERIFTVQPDVAKNIFFGAETFFGGVGKDLLKYE